MKNNRAYTYEFNQINRQNENICDYTIKDVPENAYSFRA